MPEIIETTRDSKIDAHVKLPDRPARKVSTKASRKTGVQNLVKKRRA